MEVDLVSLGTFGKILEIIVVNIVLSGDNAVVIALACRNLPMQQRKLGIMLGTGVAVVLRIVFYLAIAWLSGVSFLKVAGALLLVWIAVKLIQGEDDTHEISASEKLWHAVRTIAVADAVMSLDNVLAIVGVARGEAWIAILGLIISIPLIVVGASLITALISRFPILVWIGAALLGWVAGEMLVDDPLVLTWLSGHAPHLVVPKANDPAGLGLEAAHALLYGTATLGVLIVLIAGFLLTRRSGSAAAKP